MLKKCKSSTKTAFWLLVAACVLLGLIYIHGPQEGPIRPSDPSQCDGP